VATKRLLALDVDGTLLRSDNTVSEANTAAVARALALGWRVVLSTGKPPWAIAALAARLGLQGPHVVANGAAVWSPEGGTEVLHQIRIADVRQALAYAAAVGRPRAVSGPRGVFCEPDWGVPEVTAALAHVGEQPPTVVPDAVAVEPQPWKVITIVPLQAPNPTAPPVASGRWVRTAPPFYEVIPAAASKAAALATVCQRLAIPREGAVAIGDSENDIEVLRWAGLGIAMANAPAHVRAVADMVTASNDQDGVAQALLRLLASEAPQPKAL